MAKIAEQGKCPYCGSEDIEYGDTNIDGDVLGYEFHCNNCGKDSTEWYDLTFVETVGDN